MRIIAGKYRGISIYAPKGLDVRPTTDRVREAMFSSLISIYGELDGAVVLDAFAGTGALGLESLSRGAEYVVFFENNERAWNNLVANFESLKDVESSCKIIFGDIQKSNFNYVLKDKLFDVLFFDPPYKMDVADIHELLKMFLDSKNIKKNAILIYEHSADKDLDAFNISLKNLGFEHIKEKQYGDIATDFYKFN